MPNAVEGARPRPRVALIGDFDQSTIDNLQLLFPTIWIAHNFSQIVEDVDPKELDLVILGSNVSEIASWVWDVHVISFSDQVKCLSGPNPGDQIFISGTSSTEEYILPELPLSYHRLRGTDLADVENIKGWLLLDICHTYTTTLADHKKANKIFLEGSVVIDPHSEMSFATIFLRIDPRLGVAWLPNHSFQIAPWVELISTEWARSDPDRFPNFGDWTKVPEWMTHEEELLVGQIIALEEEKRKRLAEFVKRIADLDGELLGASRKANKGMRRLITSQGDDLVDEVASAFISLGFDVSKIDEELPKGSPKREDLRIRDPDIVDWEAIVEVRGYSKSGGNTADLSRLARFARFYELETAKPPNKSIYVVNGQINLPPTQRQAPLISSPEDVHEFGEQCGVIIWTLDLFQVLKTLSDKDLLDIRRSFREVTARWP